MERGFLLIDADDYGRLQTNDFIKFEGKDGNMRLGGYIQYAKTWENGTHWMVKPANGEGSPFPVHWDRIEKVWKRIPIEFDVLQGNIDNRQWYITDLAHWLLQVHGQEFLEFMEARESTRYLKT